MGSCLVCLAPLQRGDYHARCARRLFGSTRVPRIDVDLARLHTLALAMVGHTTFSGVQRKISLRFAQDRTTLYLATEEGQFILKPQAQTFPALPENEHLTMLIAESAGVEIPPCGLVRLTDGTLAYLVRRFDRVTDGRKLAVEDFCQLAELSPKQKYEGSAERCARLVLRFASEPIVEALKLFRLVAVSWWVGNGDLHLKNFSLMRTPEGLYRLTPAYDVLSTRLVIPGDQLALPVAGNRKNVTRRQWFEFAERCRVPERAAARVLGDLKEALPNAVDLVQRSFLPDEMKPRYAALLEERAQPLVST